MKNLRKLGILLFVGATLTLASIAQPQTGWMLMDAEKDGIHGISEQKAYQMLANRKPRKVVVAVIDSGVDIDHEDLKDIIWKNPGEIPGNGIDDDKNGYIDDVHGWNFIGGKNGSHVNQDSYEITRIYARLKKKFDGKSADQIGKKEKVEFALYEKIKKEIEEKVANYTTEMLSIQYLYDSFNDTRDYIIKNFDIIELNPTTLSALKIEDEKMNSSVQTLNLIMLMTGSENFDQLMKELDGALSYYNDAINYGYNVEFDPRHIVGDDYNNSSERFYGNNDVKGPDPSHGTHVAGIIAAKRNNGIGMDGIADNVEIMVLRVVPNGDERDKDVANGIRYAADNGALVINMSFGKKYVHDKKVVDDAIKYAESKGVLLIHAGGNESEDIDIENFYPSRKFLKGQAKNWIEVGALNWRQAPDLAGSFSNYGKKNLDLFAPGVDIYSTYPGSTYEFQQGTSMAAPVVSGVAAVLFSYFPELNASDIKKALLESVHKFENIQVTRPGGEDMMPFNMLCRTGGAVNLFNAVNACMKMLK